MKLSVIVIAYDMVREIPRTLQSLSRNYQLEATSLDYEVLVIENGSNDRLDRTMVESFGPNFHYHYLENPPPSPAYAINYGVERSSGDILCLMIDGAHLLTPGAFKLALAAFRAFAMPVVATRYFFLGPEEQNQSVLAGYSKAEEDELLGSINWPHDGYRLYEIGVPLQGDVPRITWFNKMAETNCMFVHRDTFESIGGADERFDFPGGGFLNIDLYLQACDFPAVVPVQLIGEGSFHQLHGGTTTNVEPAERDLKVQQYLDQYQKIRQCAAKVSDKDFFYLGHLPTPQSKIHTLNKPYNRRFDKNATNVDGTA